MYFCTILVKILPKIRLFLSIFWVWAYKFYLKNKYKNMVIWAYELFLRFYWIWQHGSYKRLFYQHEETWLHLPSQGVSWSIERFVICILHSNDVSALITNYFKSLVPVSAILTRMFWGIQSLEVFKTAFVQCIQFSWRDWRALLFLQDPKMITYLSMSETSLSDCWIL